MSVSSQERDHLRQKCPGEEMGSKCVQKFMMAVYENAVSLASES